VESQTGNLGSCVAELCVRIVDTVGASRTLICCARNSDGNSRTGSCEHILRELTKDRPWSGLVNGTIKTVHFGALSRADSQRVTQRA